MTYSHAKDQVQRAVGSNNKVDYTWSDIGDCITKVKSYGSKLESIQVETQTDGWTEAIAIPDSLLW